eukprot:559840-Rhodomonas_salina.1
MNWLTAAPLCPWPSNTCVHPGHVHTLFLVTSRPFFGHVTARAWSRHSSFTVTSQPPYSSVLRTEEMVYARFGSGGG